MWIWWVITPLCTANTPNWVNDNNIVFQAEPTVEYIENLQHTLQSIFNATNFYVDATGTCWCYSPPPFAYIKTIVSSEYIPLSDNTPATAFQQFYTYTLLTSLLEEYLAFQYGSELASDILHIGHHGSQTSSIVSFLKAVSPHIGVISVGKKNSYGHPSSRVLWRLSQLGIAVFETSEIGDILSLY